jgi:hypothetical protein
MIILQTVGLRRVISLSQGLYLNTGQHKHNKDIDIPNNHALCGIRTQDPGFGASEDSTWVLGFRNSKYSFLRTECNSIRLSTRWDVKLLYLLYSDRHAVSGIMALPSPTRIAFEWIDELTWNFMWVCVSWPTFVVLNFLPSVILTRKPRNLRT